MPEIPNNDYESSEVVAQESWDYDTFVAEYNKAVGTNFHPYVPDEDTQYLQKRYERSDRQKTIKEFAISQLDREQVYADDVLPKYRD